MNIDRVRIKRVFREYTDSYDSEDPKVRLKVEHTYRVAEIGDRIERSENSRIAEADRGLGWLLGILHDIGRFEQLRRYHTFFDSKSIDHAELGADILFKDGLIRKFIDDEVNDNLLEKAVRCHNKLALPDGLEGRESFFANLLRDADKVDILKVICDTPFDDLNDFTKEELAEAAISDDVFTEAMSHKTVNRRISKTPMDQYINKITFVYGLVFPESIKLVKEQGYLLQMLDYRTKNPETEERLKTIRKDVMNYMDSRVKY